MTPLDLKHLEPTFAELTGNVRIVYFTEEVNCRHCRQERDLLATLADLSHKLKLEVYNFTADRDQAAEYRVDKVPGFLLVGSEDPGIWFSATGVAAMRSKPLLAESQHILRDASAEWTKRHSLNTVAGSPVALETT